MRRLAAVVLAAGLAAPAAAQSWDTPSFFAPGPHDEIALHLISPDNLDLGFMALWRQSGRLNLGVRGGMGGVEGNRSILLGAEFYGPLVRPSGQNVLAVSWIVGAGASFNDVTAFRIPIGLSAGAVIEGEGFTVTPYAHPRIALDIISFDVGDEEETDTDLNIDADFGADLALGQSFILRFGLTVGENEVWGVGLAYRIPRRVAVR